MSQVSDLDPSISDDFGGVCAHCGPWCEFYILSTNGVTWCMNGDCQEIIHPMPIILEDHNDE